MLKNNPPKAVRRGKTVHRSRFRKPAKMYLGGEKVVHGQHSIPRQNHFGGESRSQSYNHKCERYGLDNQYGSDFQKEGADSGLRRAPSAFHSLFNNDGRRLRLQRVLVH